MRAQELEVQACVCGKMLQRGCTLIQAFSGPPYLSRTRPSLTPPCFDIACVLIVTARRFVRQAARPEIGVAQRLMAPHGRPILTLLKSPGPCQCVMKEAQVAFVARVCPSDMSLKCVVERDGESQNDVVRDRPAGSSCCTLFCSERIKASSQQLRVVIDDARFKSTVASGCL